MLSAQIKLGLLYLGLLTALAFMASGMAPN